MGKIDKHTAHTLQKPARSARPRKTSGRVLLRQRLRELNAQQIEKESADQELALELLEARHRQAVERLSRAKVS